MNEIMPEREMTAAELKEAQQYALVIEWSPEDDAFVVSIPDIPGIHTHGATRAEAATAGDEVLALWLSSRRRAGRPIPPATFNARYGISTPAPANEVTRRIG
jgi:predicted RNase H-like HicB family nuclease